MLKWIVSIISVIALAGVTFLCLPKNVATETVISKYTKFIPAYTDTTFIQSGKSLIPITNYHPDETDYYVKTKNFDVSVEESLYNDIKENDVVKIYYKHIIFNIVYKVKKGN